MGPQKIPRAGKCGRAVFRRLTRFPEDNTFARFHKMDQPPEIVACENGPKPRPIRLWLSLILLLGFGIRVTGLWWGQAYCYGSQGDCLEAYQVAVNYARGEEQAQYLGQPNYNKHAKLPGPLWTLFCREGLRLGGGSLAGAVWLIILLNTGAIYLTYLLAARTVGAPAALWAALLMAVSPSAVFYSAVVFNPCVMPLAGGLLFLALWRTACQGRTKVVFWIPFLLLAMLQFHMSGLMLIPAVVLVLALSPARLNYPWLAAGVLAGFCLYLPYIHGEMAHGWENTRGMVTGAGNPYWPGTLRIFIAPLSFLVNLWTPLWVYTPAEYGNMGRACFGAFGLFLAVNALSVVAAAFLVWGAFWLIKKNLRGFFRSPRAGFARAPGIVFLAVVFLVPLLANFSNAQVFQGRYCLVLLPVLFSLAGAGVGYWLARPHLRRTVPIILLVSTGATAWFMPAMFHFQKTFIQDGPRFVPGLAKLETVYQRLKAHAGKDHRVQVDDADYLQALPQQEKLLHQAGLIRWYVAIREKEDSALPGNTAAMTCRLRAADQVRPEDPAVIYIGNGIALVVQTSKP